MNVWIFQTGEPLHCDLGDYRPMRAMNLADALVESGHTVTIWSSAFFHQERRNRSLKFERKRIGNLLTIGLIPSIGYSKNIGIRRLIDHFQLAYNLKKILQNEVDGPDVAFVGYPPIEFAFVAANWLKKRRINFIVDVKDQWPNIFIEAVPKWLRPFMRILLQPYYIMGRETLSSAAGLSTMAEGYLEWMYEFSGRKNTDLDLVSPLTAPIPKIESNKIADAEKWWAERGVTSCHKRRFCFIGSFMSVFDFSSIRDAAKQFQDEGLDCQFIMCGDGGSAHELKQLMKGLDNVIFPGRIDITKILVLTKISSGTLIPYKNIENYTRNLPNKVIDALAFGLPIITTLSGELQSLIEKENIGFVCNFETKITVYEALKRLLEDEQMCDAMSTRANNLYQKSFSFNQVYSRLVKHLEFIASNKPVL